jgi:hypothetical protein
VEKLKKTTTILSHYSRAPNKDMNPTYVGWKVGGTELLNSEHFTYVSYRNKNSDSYGLNDRVSIPGGAGNFSLHHRVQNGSGVHPASYPMGIRGSFSGDKAAGA